MTIHAFAGPSLRPADRGSCPEICWNPPAEAGDLLRLDTRPGDIVCLIDGYFDHRPAVRHKELLLLLSQGIAVLGASSIGALRAAEMDGLGLIGVGAVYRAYASGRLTADDEVALVHAPAEWDWKPLSLPLVDCRASLLRAVRARIVTGSDARAILETARSVHYADREWPSLLSMTSINEGRRGTLLEWIARNDRSQKRIDALECLYLAQRGGFRMAAAPPMVETSLFNALVRESHAAARELR